MPGASVPEVPGDFFEVTVDHLFGEIWTREGLSMRDRRMLLLGVIAAVGEWSVLPIQLDAILSNEELTADELREMVDLPDPLRRLAPRFVAQPNR